MAAAPQQARSSGSVCALRSSCSKSSRRRPGGRPACRRGLHPRRLPVRRRGAPVAAAAASWTMPCMHLAAAAAAAWLSRSLARPWRRRLCRQHATRQPCCAASLVLLAQARLAVSGLRRCRPRCLLMARRQPPATTVRCWRRRGAGAAAAACALCDQARCDQAPGRQEGLHRCAGASWRVRGRKGQRMCCLV